MTMTSYEITMVVLTGVLVVLELIEKITRK